MKSINKLSHFFNSLSFRSIIIAILSLVMMIPLLLVNDTIEERGNRYHDVLQDIASSWGQQQTLVGPVLAVPYVEHVVTVNTVTDVNGENKTVSKDVFHDRTMILLPEELDIKAALNEEYRKRGIYNSLVYNSDITLEGHFNIQPLLKACFSNCKIIWHKAWLSVGLTDTKAITDASRLIWNGTSISINPGTKLAPTLTSGFHASIQDNQPQTPLPTFRLKISVNGSKGIRFAPLGEVTRAKITSSWPHPSFQGQVLPKEQEITGEGFSARWQIPNLARSYPQTWLLQKAKKGALPQHDLHEFTTGVDLFEPLSLYSKISRATKYGILFIALTYVTFLIFELTVQARPHFVQYVLIGLSMSLFYLLLVSLAEHVKFLYAYLAASGVTVFLITLYAIALLKKFGRALVIGLLLTGLYGLLYTILHLEDYALLAGSGLLLIIITVLMYVTRNIEHKL